MKFTSIWIILVLLFTTNMVFGQNSEVKLMTYNMRIASPPSKGWGVTEIDSIAAVLNRNPCDLIALQEVDAFTTRSGRNLDEAKRLGELTGMHHFFAKAIDRSDGDYGVSVLSKFPIVKADAYRIFPPDSVANEIRGLAVIEVKLNKKSVIFASFHLDHLNDEVRSFQLKQIFEKLKKYKGKPIIMGADLNMSAKSPLFEMIHNNGWKILDKNKQMLTFPNDQPKVTLDYFLFNKAFEKQWKGFDLRVIYKESYASDHLPVILTLNKK